MHQPSDSVAGRIRPGAQEHDGYSRRVPEDDKSPGPQKHGQPLLRETKMNKSYWGTTYRNINDPTALAAYAELATTAIAAAGGRFVVRGMQSEVHEQGLSERTIVIEFPSVEHAVAAYASTAYQHALAALGRGAERDVRIVAGAE